ncbi:MAG: hypothetical protein KDD40_03995, partial [Bdellovibrionales bacterium]|nr:hypothetical protein [Bdellovibrionales bacterium]
LVSFAQETYDETSENKMAMKEFVRSCTYGVLAGTLVGAATLAFTEQPGENINRVARGASLGLYAGILLGLYVVYIVPGQINEELEDDSNLLPPGESLEESSFHWQAFPVVSQNQDIDGLALGFNFTF